MGDMYSIIDGLCREKGTNITRMCKDTGIPRSVFSELKAGRTKQLSNKYSLIVAEYLGVSVDYLLGKEEKPADKGEQIDLSDIEIGFLGDYKELTEENKATVRDMVRLMRERQKEG